MRTGDDGDGFNWRFKSSSEAHSLTLQCVWESREAVADAVTPIAQSGGGGRGPTGMRAAEADAAAAVPESLQSLRP